MRKLVFVLLFILLVTASGCRAEKSLLNDTSVSISDISTDNIREAEEPPESDSPSVLEETVPPKQTESEAPKQTLPGASNDPTEKPPVQTESPTPEPESEETKPSVPETVLPEESTDPPPTDMEAEYKRIIREATAYAESYAAKGFTFHWDDSLDFNWETGYMGTPRVKYEGVDGAIQILKHHIDRIVQTATDPSNGIPASAANYKVMQITVDDDIAFVVLYG